jgi:hypothetical protein
MSANVKRKHLSEIRTAHIQFTQWVVFSYSQTISTENAHVFKNTDKLCLKVNSNISSKLFQFLYTL